MEGSRKGNVREGEKQLLSLFVKRNGQGLKGKRDMRQDGRVGEGGQG
jgi:hypothetical protein